MENKSYEKTILWSATFLSLFALAACSNSKSSENQTKKENTSSSKVTSSSKTSNGKNSATHSTNTSPSSSQANTNNSEKVQKSSSPLSGYSAEQVEYACVTETLLSYYKYDYQPVSISVTKNGANHQVFPFSGSVVVPQDTVTLSFSSDNTMAGTTIVTYSSNHNGSINFYKDPNHYQDERYLKDSAWVKEESQKLLDSSQTLAIPTSFDEQAAQIISKIEIK
ncbi:hypothetical protein [Lactococcus lactis]|uniref:Lipoprotein n=1 Tax=Lactococcus lactis subsp. lactis TaxID=1360 RepID=A0A1V0NDG3_LACLL|nr:hypothetical protein [Lactococcus lactis]MRL88167.1 hypothetical protein [Lactococcus cremoris]ADZ62938.1 putative lipoprotein [Lactococcus lactis subsp. lactis CV56]ARD97962.1 lipoprotein [Lactococcus lactis subsp. lactis]EHE93057.1 hypothetical protein LLCRE1631_01768 [Lactococcus lactis subsp. lactis CNCM I-1631]KSU28821.1 hypothetical protein NCDO895_1008 [Lactococcus lactis subsp. lactis]